MATRQYIGARYVTKIYKNSQDPSSAEWESGVTYEPLTMVTYLNNSYMSRDMVPASAGNPVTETDHWALTGFYNGQIAALNERMTELEADNTLINAQIAVERKSPVHAKIIMIGDSYLAMTEVTNYGEVLQDLLPNATFEIHADPGSGFTHYGTIQHKAFEGLLDDAIALHTDDGDTIDFVIAIGGSNDRDSTQSTVGGSIDVFFNKARAAFPSAQLVLGFCGWTNLTGSSADKRKFLICRDTYRNHANYGVAWIDGLNTVMHDYSHFYDAGHPDNTTHARIARFIYDFLINGAATSVLTETSTYTYGSGVTKDQYSDDLRIQAVRSGLETTITISGGFGNAANYGQMTYDITTPIPSGGGVITLANITGGLVFGVENQDYTGAVGGCATSFMLYNSSSPQPITVPGIISVNSGRLLAIPCQGYTDYSSLNRLKVMPIVYTIPTDFC